MNCPKCGSTLNKVDVKIPGLKMKRPIIPTAQCPNKNCTYFRRRK